MQQSILVISMILTIILASTIQAIPQPTCLKDGNECAANSDCCNGCCVKNHCVDYYGSCPSIIFKRETDRHSTCENLNPPCKPPNTCVLQEVQCFRAPCYPIPICVKQ